MELYDEIKSMLIRRGWLIDNSATENLSGELCEFIHPVIGKRMAYIDAILAEQDREVDNSNGQH